MTDFEWLISCNPVFLTFDVATGESTNIPISRIHEWHLSGDIYYDGSCFSHHNDPLLARAGWAAIQLNPAGQLVAVLMGCVPQPEPQTSAMSERHGNTAVNIVVTFPARLHGDCKSVVEDDLRARHTLFDARNLHADKNLRIWRIRQEEWPQYPCFSHMWVKAHTLGDDEDPLNIACPVLRRHGIGNRFADLYAKRAARELHPGMNDLNWGALLLECKRRRRILRTMARVAAPARPRPHQATRHHCPHAQLP